MENAQKLIAAYKQLGIEKGVLSVSYKEISSAAELEIEDFKATFPSLEALQSAVWMDYLRKTLETLESSEEFVQYSVREKLLAYYYTFFEIINRDAGFVNLFASKLGIWNYEPSFLREFKKAFLSFVSSLMAEGIESGEIEERMILGDEYVAWHWPQMLFLLNKWIDDTAENKASSDQAIEKAVNLGFDIMGRNLFDSAFDFAKYMFTSH